MTGQKLAEEIFAEHFTLDVSDESRLAHRGLQSSRSVGSAPPTETRNPGTIVPSKYKQFESDLGLLGGTIILSCFACYYVFQTFLVNDPSLGRLLFSPSTTVFVINVLSQALAVLYTMVFLNAFQTSRWRLAARERGVSLSAFIGMSGATSVLGVGMLLRVKGTHRLWCVQRHDHPVRH
jgi:hypothetical protein